MFENAINGRRRLLAALLGAGLISGTVGIVLSAQALTVTAHADCTAWCNGTTVLCSGVCFCNNPDNMGGQCLDDIPC
jgi:hypothetical protein